MKHTILLAVLALATAARAAYVDIVPAELRHYKVNEKVTFKVAAYDKPGKLLNKGKFTITVSEAGNRKLMDDLTVDLAEKNDFTFTVSLDRPGFILASAGSLNIDGKKVKWSNKPYRPYGGAAVEPEKIPMAAPRPADFDKFWADGLKEFNAAQVIVTPEKKLKRKGYDVSKIEVKFPGNRGSIYGYLSIPQDRSKKYPAQIGVPGAGAGSLTVAPYYRSSSLMIEAWLNVHKFAPGKNNAEQKKRLAEFTKKLPEKFYPIGNISDRNTYFFRDVWLALSKVVDYVATLKEFDGKNFAAIGSSQGGGTALAVAYLNKKISCVFVNVPALCDHSGWMVKRVSGWPQAHAKSKGKGDKVMPYFDGINFAAGITVPTFVTVGFIDTTCPPAGVYAMYNQLKGKKQMYDMPRLGHVVPPEMRKLTDQFYQQEFCCITK